MYAVRLLSAQIHNMLGTFKVCLDEVAGPIDLPGEGRSRRFPSIYFQAFIARY
jgi:hypothetical protein